jgi:DNA-binding transcriptional LysR family regulator
MHIDLVDLRLLVAVAETNSLTGGAARCHLSLPAVSMRIKNLEEGVGAKLMYRSSLGVTLTPAGQTLLRHARQVLGQMEQLRGDMQTHGRGIKGHLRLYASATAMAEFLPEVLQAFLASHPDVNIDLREHMSADIVRAVTQGQTDIGVVSGTVSMDRLEVLPYRDDRLVLVVGSEHVFADQAAVAFADTLDHEQVSLADTAAIHTFIQQQADALNRSVKLRIQVGSFETSARMIAAGIGIGVMPESAARRHAQHLNIRIVALSDTWALRQQFICVRSFATLPVFARELVAMMTPDLQAALG